MAELDAILIPGGGVLATGKVTPWVEVRLARAIARATAGCYFIPLSAGTTHKPPPLDTAGFPILESLAGGGYLAEQGIPRSRILPETVSLDTIGNAYFARVQHTDPLGLRALHVITSQFHLPRTQTIFEWIFQLSSPAEPYRLTFEAVPDIGITAMALQARQAREHASLQTVFHLRSRLTTLPDVHRWLYTEHAAYAIGAVPSSLQGQSLESY